MSSESWHPINIQQLRQSLKMKWLTYYKTNRRWLVRMQVWGSFNGRRRPYSGFILATITALEPKLHHILPFILDLNNNPDDIVAALGLNFNPEEQLHLVHLQDNSTNPTNVKPIENQTIPKPSDKSKALAPVQTRIVDSFKQQNDKLREGTQSERAITVKATTQSDQLRDDAQSDRLREDAQSDQLRDDAQSDRKFFSQKPLPNSQTNLQKLTSDTHQSVPVRSRAEIEDTRGKAVQKEIGLNQPAKTEVQVNNKFHSEEKGKLTTNFQPDNSQPDNDNEAEKQPVRINKLTKWIDELCQGNAWDRDDMVFIRF